MTMRNSPIISMAKSCGKIMLLAGLYIISGKLGLLLAVPPGYATIIWPASGIAIGMLITYGWRLWPGVLIGSFILNCYISNAFSLSDGFVTTKALVALGIASGSTIQALVGRLLVQRYLGLPLAFRHVKEMLLLFALSGPLACLIAATVGISCLHFTGILPLEKAPHNWLTWWLGDTFGVMVFLPLVLIAPGSANRLTWRGNTLGTLPVLAMLALVLPLGLTFYAWKITSESGYQQNKIGFQTLVLENEKALLHRIDSYNFALLGGAGLFQSTDHVSRKDWHNFVEALNIKKNFPGMNALSWVQPVEPEQLASFLEAVRKDDAPDFTIHPATQDKPYYIITYVDPEEGNREAIGLNSAYEQKRQEAIELARDSGNEVMTKRIVLLQDKENTPGFILLHPVYNNGLPLDSLENRRKAFKGWVTAPFIAKNFLHDLTTSQGVTQNIKIYDGTEPLAENLIYDSYNGKVNADTPAFTITKQLTVMQQKWLVVWNSTPTYERISHNDAPIYILMGGLLFTGLFGLFLMVISVRRTETMQWIVEEKRFALPLAIFIIITSASLYMYDTLRLNETTYIQNTIKEEANKIEQLVTSQTNDKLLALKRMSQRWEASGGTPFDQWRADAKNYTDQLAGLKTIEWVDQTYHVHWAEPLQGNEKVIGLNILFDNTREQALKGAAEKDAITLTPPLDLVQGYKAFIAYAPAHVKGSFDGFMVGVFAIRPDAKVAV